MTKHQDIIIKVSGSLIYPVTGLNIQYLKKLNSFIRKQIAKNKNWRFFIMIGGGHVKNEYQYTAERIIGKIKDQDLNWLGIHATRLNAHLIRTIFRDIAYSSVLTHYDKLPPLTNQKLIICSGWLPGSTTDFDMINLAKLLKVKTVYALLNVKGVYDRDPKIFKTSKLLKKLPWSDYRAMIGEWWHPKRQLPFDPFAAKLAEAFEIKAAFLDGKNLKNLENALKNKQFLGTIIE